MNGNMTVLPNFLMRSIKDRIADLERDLVAPELAISAYHDLPFAIFRYETSEELIVRTEMNLLAVRLKNQYGKKVVIISLTGLMFRALGETRGGIEKLALMEEKMGLEITVQQVHRTISAKMPLHELVARELEQHHRDHNTIAFLYRAGGLFPAFRTSALLEKLKGDTPTVLFYPGTLEGTVGLRFMGVCEAEHNYRPKIY